MRAINDKRFNLIDEEWIDVLDSTSKVVRVSIRTLFKRAQEYKSISSSYPTVEISILRFLEAIITRAFAPFIEQGVKRSDIMSLLWGEQGHQQFMGAISSYLDKHHDGFWMVHPERPFYQINGLAHAKNPPSPMAFMTLDAVDDSPLFQTHGRSKEFSFGEAAQWLLHQQYVDPMKNMGFSASYAAHNTVGHLCYGKHGNMRGTQFVQHGQNLYKTLLLNHYNSDRIDAVYPKGQDTAPWEEDRPVEEYGGKMGIPSAGIADRLARRSRNVTFITNGDKVVGFYKFYANVLAFPYSSAEIEPFAATRRKTDGAEPYLAMSGAGSSWDVFSALSATDFKNSEPAPLISQTANLRDRGIIPENTVVTIEVIEVVYGQNDQKIDSVRRSYLDLPVALLLDNSEDGRVIRTTTMIKDAGRQAREMVVARSRFESSIAASEGANADRIFEVAREKHTRIIDRKFRSWVHEVSTALPSDDNQFTALKSEWLKAVRPLDKKSITDAMKVASSRAMVGRGDNNIFTAANRLNYGFKKIFGEITTKEEAA